MTDVMNFEVLKQSIVDDVLVPAEAGRYETVGAKRQRESADAINAKRRVMVIYKQGEMPKGGSTSYGSVQHDTEFEIVMTVAVAAKADLSVLNNPDSSEADRSQALRDMRLPSIEADSDMDSFIAMIWRILMDARNDQMGIDPPASRPNLKAVADRWVSNISKGDPVPQGEYVVLTASMRLTCSIEETIPGEELVNPGNKTFESDITLEGDEAEQGVEQITP